MRKVCLLLMMLCISISSVAQKPQAKDSPRRQTTKKAQPSQKPQKSQQPQKSQKSQKSQKPQQPSQKQQLQAQQKQLRKDIAANKRQKAELEKKVKKQLEDVLILATEIEEQKRIVDTLKLGLDSIDWQIATLNSQMEKLKGELRERQKRYANSVRYMHRNRTMQSRMMFLLSAKNINQAYRRTRFMNEYATYQRAQGEAVKQKQAQVEQKRLQVEQAKAEQAQMLARQQQEQQTLERQQDQKQLMANALQKQQRTVTALIDRQQKEEAAVNEQIDRLIAEEIAREQARLEAERKRREEQARLEREQKAREQREREQREREKALARQQKQEKKKDKAIEKQVRREIREESQRSQKSQKSQHSQRSQRSQRFQRSQQPQRSQRSQQSQQPQHSQHSQQPQLAYSSSDPDTRLTGSFASNKGRLPMPITGAYQMIRSFGENVVDGARGVHLSSKGIYLKGQPGAQARCVFDGEVSKVFSTGSSYIVMVRHGRFISVYSDLASVSVAAGQKVTTSQTLGKLGPTNIMQFQLRNWTELLNPRNWLRR